MAKAISLGYTDTAVSALPDGIVVEFIPKNWEEDMDLLSNVPGESVYTNLKAPTDQEETYRFAVSPVANVYAGTDIDPSAYLPTRRGTKILVDVKGVGMETDTDDSTYRKAIPFRGTLTMTVPAYGNVTAQFTRDIAKALFSALHQMGEEGDTGVAALMHGVTTKKHG